MKKLKYIILPLLFFTILGCALGNTPTSKVEDFFSKYQMLDKKVENDIDKMLEEEDLTIEQKESYKKTLEKQYKNLTYEIKDEKIDGDIATVTTEIEVLDYRKASVGTSSTDERIKMLENAKEKVTYTLSFEVVKDDEGNWVISPLSKSALKKIQGMY